jgi:hypothetical protein
LESWTFSRFPKSKKQKGGGFEIRFYDRIKALEKLEVIASHAGKTEKNLDNFFDAIRREPGQSNNSPTTMTEFAPFSKKQLKTLTWWCPGSGFSHRDAIICDGAVRSGKTLCMSLSFVAWATFAFSGQAFALCGKTITSLRRNVVTGLTDALTGLGFVCSYKSSQNFLDISYGGRSNRFYLFGGKDESSCALIQGMTLAGVMFDEVALMPRSFVGAGARALLGERLQILVQLQPGTSPPLVLPREWIGKRDLKNALYLHFQWRQSFPFARYSWRGTAHSIRAAFYERFVLGKWVAPQGWFTRCSPPSGMLCKRRRTATGFISPATTVPSTPHRSGCGGTATGAGTVWGSTTTTPAFPAN